MNKFKQGYANAIDDVEKIIDKDFVMRILAEDVMIDNEQGIKFIDIEGVKLKFKQEIARLHYCQQEKKGCEGTLNHTSGATNSTLSKNLQLKRSGDKMKDSLYPADANAKGERK